MGRKGGFRTQSMASPHASQDANMPTPVLGEKSFSGAETWTNGCLKYEHPLVQIRPNSCGSFPRTGKSISRPIHAQNLSGIGQTVAENEHFPCSTPQSIPLSVSTHYDKVQVEFRHENSTWTEKIAVSDMSQTPR